MKNYENDIAITYIDRDWPDIEKEIRNHVTDWSVCIQAGGHLGLYPTRLSKLFNTVHTFEADAGNYQKLVENCSDENNIACYHNALSAYSRAMGIWRVPGGNTGQNFVVQGDDVDAITIDSLNLPSCGLIQLDIERHELFALMGAIETIEKFRPVIILEGPETTNNACNIILEQLGYEFIARAGQDSVFVYTNSAAPTTEYRDVNMKKILVAIPTARYIEPDTFKSIYDLDVPAGYEITFQHFYGYRVDQVRNLICDWVARGYDYLLAVDHDVTFAPDTLRKLLDHNVDLVSGVYRQRLEPQAIEIYDLNQQRMTIDQIYGKDLVRIGACGFGCVLVKKEVIVGVGYPQFEYHPALDHGKTVSEDTDFCRKATNNGFELWCDPSILCGHIGSTTMYVKTPEVAINPVETRLRGLSLRDDLPRDHVDYLKGMDINPKVIYDIGACIMHWTKEANRIWPDSKIVMFDAMDHAEFLYKESGHEYYCGQAIGDVSGKSIDFYEKPMDPAGNSYYKENSAHFTEADKVTKTMITLDDLVTSRRIQLPDLVKIDVQGAELDVLRGAQYTLKDCNDIIIEMQHEEYNLGAPQVAEVTEYLNMLGFKLVSVIRTTGADGDYHFARAKL